jgi:hypothetical protein
LYDTPSIVTISLFLSNWTVLEDSRVQVFIGRGRAVHRVLQHLLARLEFLDGIVVLLRVEVGLCQVSLVFLDVLAQFGDVLHGGAGLHAYNRLFYHICPAL